VIKQADVVLAMFLLGNAFSPEAQKRNFEFYDPLTTGDSSLSSCVEAIIAAQVGDTEKAIRYGMAALLMDLADVGGNVKDGCHIASMGGTWVMLIYGLGGMRESNFTGLTPHTCACAIRARAREMAGGSSFWYVRVTSEGH